MSLLKRPEDGRAFHYLKLATVVFCLVAGSAATTVAVTQIFLGARVQPIQITACTPESYDPPALIGDGPMAEQGPPQAECERWFALPNDTWPVDEPIPVTGQVCNSHDEPVAVLVSVAFESVSTVDVRLPVIEVPITYDPGCQAPYEFPYEFPLNAITDAAEPGESFGQWRIVGTVEPVNPDKFLPYQWDATATVEFVNP